MLVWQLNKENILVCNHSIPEAHAIHYLVKKTKTRILCTSETTIHRTPSNHSSPGVATFPLPPLASRAECYLIHPTRVADPNAGNLIGNATLVELRNRVSSSGVANPEQEENRNRTRRGGDDRIRFTRSPSSLLEVISSRNVAR